MPMATTMDTGTVQFGQAELVDARVRAVGQVAVFDEITADLEAIIEQLAAAPPSGDTLGDALDRVNWSLHAAVQIADFMAAALQQAGSNLLVAASR